jgi:glycosyltransferase involved in cell wall biosynthesis
MARLSVIIICRDEAHQIARCLESVRFADEVVVLDSGSTDDTVAIARRFTPMVFQQPWLGFGPQKNAAMQHATGDWILAVDCDEWVSQELASSIRQAMDGSHGHAGFQLRRRSTLLGRPVRLGDWMRDRPLRLFRRGAGRFSEDAVHERLVLHGSTGLLPGTLHHHPFHSLHAMVETMNRYSDLSADMPGRRGSPPPVALLRAVGAFLRGYLLKGGFLDGAAGLLVAVGTAEGTFWRHVKRWAASRSLKP